MQLNPDLWPPPRGRQLIKLYQFLKLEWTDRSCYLSDSYPHTQVLRPPWTVTHGDCPRCSVEAWAQPLGGLGRGSGTLQGTVLSLSQATPAHLLVPRPEAQEDLGQRAQPTSHCTFCLEDHWESDCWQRGISSHCSKGLVLMATSGQVRVAC